MCWRPEEEEETYAECREEGTGTPVATAFNRVSVRPQLLHSGGRKASRTTSVRRSRDWRKDPLAVVFYASFPPLELLGSNSPLRGHRSRPLVKICCHIRCADYYAALGSTGPWTELS